MNPAPIALFAYNRPHHLARTVAALARNPEAPLSELFVFSDGPKHSGHSEGVQAVRAFLKTITGFKAVHIIERPKNCGLANSLITGITEICNTQGRVIVIEDDQVVCPFFLRYVNQGLDLYEHDEEVISINGYTPPVKQPIPETFFLTAPDCVGWATWKRGWSLFMHDPREILAEVEKRGIQAQFDFNHTFGYMTLLLAQIEGKVDSWAIRWYASGVIHRKLSLYPRLPLVDHAGMDGSGTHCPNNGNEPISLAAVPIHVERIPIVENQEARLAFEVYYRSLHPGLFSKLRMKLGRWRRQILGQPIP